MAFLFPKVTLITAIYTQKERRSQGLDKNSSAVIMIQNQNQTSLHKEADDALTS